MYFLIAFSFICFIGHLREQADAGLTGRKIIVDTYGGWGAHGGGAFSGKDPTKVDRSGAYAARWVAKSLVNAGLVKRCLVQVFIGSNLMDRSCLFHYHCLKLTDIQLSSQISYAIGIAKPISITLFTYGTGMKSDAELLEIVNANFDLRPGKIIK